MNRFLVGRTSIYSICLYRNFNDTRITIISALGFAWPVVMCGGTKWDWDNNVCVVRHLLCRFKSQVVTSTHKHTIQFPFFLCLAFYAITHVHTHTHTHLQPNSTLQTKSRFQTILNKQFNKFHFNLLFHGGCGMAPISIYLCIFHKFTPLEWQRCG